MTTETTKEAPKEAKKAPVAAKTKKGPDVADLTRAMLAKSVGLKPLDTAPSTMAHVPSGTIVVDNLIGGSRAQDGKGQVCPGYPRRKITEIYGPESSGKTTLALAAVANVQRAGGTVLYLDFEHALHHGYAKQIGVKFDKTFMLVAPDTMEDGFKAMYVGLLTGVDLIVVDSVAAMVPKAEFEKKIDDAAKVGAVAKKMAETLPKFALWLMKFPTEGTGEAKKTRKDHPGTAIILLNQERASINTGGGQSHGGPETNTSGGKALKYFAYVRLRLSRISSETIEKKDPLTGKKKKFPYGNLTNVRMIKSKADAKQGHSANIFIRYGFGVDDAYSMIESGIVHGVIVREGAYYSYEGQRIQSRDKFRQFLLSNPKVYEEVKNKVIQAILDAAPQVVADEELSDEDMISAQVEAEFGDEGEEDGEAAEVTLDESEASDASEPAVEEAPGAE